MIRLTLFSFSVASALWFAPLASRWCVLSASEMANSGGLITGFLWPPAFRVLCRGFFFLLFPGAGWLERTPIVALKCRDECGLSTSSPRRTQFDSKTWKINVGGLKRVRPYRPLRHFVDYQRKYFWLVPEKNKDG